jgi:hypothetical protein
MPEQAVDDCDIDPGGDHLDVGWRHGFDGLSATPEVSKEASYSMRIVLGSAPAVALFSEVFLEQSEPRSKLSSDLDMTISLGERLRDRMPQIAD